MAKWCVFFRWGVGCKDSNAAEIAAIHKAVSICSSSQALRGQVISVVSDSTVAVSWINNKDYGSLEHFSLISFIRAQLNSLDGLEVVYDSRMFN